MTGALQVTQQGRNIVHVGHQDFAIYILVRPEPILPSNKLSKSPGQLVQQGNNKRPLKDLLQSLGNEGLNSPPLFFCHTVGQDDMF